MRNRKQDGQIIVINDRWYVRFYSHQNIGGEIQRKRITACLGPVTTRGKYPPSEIQQAAENHMRTINESPIPAERNVSLCDFATNVFLPWVKTHKRASTYKTYKGIWEDHIKPVAGRDCKSLKGVRTYHVQQWLDQIGKSGLAKNTLKHIKSVISAIFTLAKQQDYFDGSNPTVDSRVDPKSTEAAEGYAYDLSEIRRILSVLPDPANLAFAIAAFAALRHGEIQGLQWPDLRDGQLWIERSVWGNVVNEPKTKKSKAPVPVIRQLAERLEMHRLRCGNPQVGPIFANSLGRRLNLNNLLAREMLPALNRCQVCGLSEGKAHLKAKDPHDYKRDERIPQWHGWHAARRGLASNLNAIGIDDSVIQRILRHSQISVTQSCYIKAKDKDVHGAMQKIEENIDAETAARALRDSNRTVISDSGAMPQSVN